MANHNHKRNLLIIVGLALGLFFLWLTFRDISWSDFVDGLAQLKPIYLIPGLIFAVGCQFIRALRFGLILSPFCSLSTRMLWDLLNIWAAANVIMPARLGEFVRPYLLHQRGVSFSSVFGAVLVERFFDMTGLLILLGAVLWKTPEVSRQYSVFGQILLAALVFGYLLVLLMLAKKVFVQNLVEKILRIFPARIAALLDAIFRKLLEGVEVMANPKRALFILLYSVTLWVLFSATTYVFLLAFGIEASFLVAVTIQVFIALAVAIPSAPGFIGTFHAAGRYALALYGIQAVVAVSFATVYHIFSLFVSIGLGALSYFTGDYRFDRSAFANQSEIS
ncbi:MAG: lysylphosphatidylglycerol synthase transmembrane domain-containing protein [Syntrophaceae bacterium]|nr:lysylphosphatidylglycerol synthase transmembrane domain-containing protein [Syntrophaceae bacterium]